MINFGHYRDPSKERRERRFRQRSPDDVRESDRAAQRMHMDRDENSREHRRQKISERLGHRTRKGDVHEENEDKDESSSSRWKERNQRYCEYCPYCNIFSDYCFKTLLKPPKFATLRETYLGIIWYVMSLFTARIRHKYPDIF